MGKFKVDDRVIAKGRGGVVGEHEGVVSAFDDYSVLVEFGDGWAGGHDGSLGDKVQNRWFFSPSVIRHAPLKIEKGKFYKTRDGQKIGPMYKFNGDTWAAEGSGRLWIDTGERYYRIDRGGPTDLVSEWTEPKVNVAAQSDTLSDEYGRGSASTPSASNDNVAKPKFKVGDWVKWPGNGWLRYYEVAHIEGDSFWIDSFGIPMRYSLSSCDWLVRSAASHGVDPTAIVALIEDGQPKPAARPYIHNTVGAATAEANRLAAKHKGQEFGVYVLNGTFQVPKPTYDHEWQRLAAAGQKVNAIKELRAITGLGLATAKNAVEDWAARAA
ncbi:ribosomal protein L7/L12 [Metarhizobium album]|nr:ribosomal protein L7/L12 [Rhizobium album]